MTFKYNVKTHVPHKAYPVAVALSGGLDSLMAAYLLKEEGYTVQGLHAIFTENDPAKGSANRQELAKACAFLGIPLHVADLREAFKKQVIEPFIEAYLAGRTPNPCASCNYLMKFGLLMDEAEKLGAASLSTGHYARQISASVQGVSKAGEGFLCNPCEVGEEGPDFGSYTTIAPAADPLKDQSYFLALIPEARLLRAFFPLYDYQKKELALLAKKLGVPVPQPKESQEICFVPGDDYRAFLKEHVPGLAGSGSVILPNGKRVGSHNGLWNYTEGQRRGLGIAWEEPLYVLKKNTEKNVLIVAPAELLQSGGCVADKINTLIPHEYWPEKVNIRVRYRQKAVEGSVKIENGRMYIAFDNAEVPPAKGQLAVIYHKGYGFILGGGIICEE